MSFFAFFQSNEKRSQSKSQNQLFQEKENHEFYHNFLSYKKITLIEISEHKIIKEKSNNYAVFIYDFL